MRRTAGAVFALLALLLVGLGAPALFATGSPSSLPTPVGDDRGSHTYKCTTEGLVNGQVLKGGGVVFGIICVGRLQNRTSTNERVS